MDANQDFWNWFASNEESLFHFEQNQGKAFGQLATALAKVDPDLTFEFGPQNDRREFVISAGGIKRAFPVVSALVSAAPKLPRWQIIGFRPRRGHTGVFEIGSTRVDTSDVEFSLLDNGRIAGLYLFIPGYEDNNTNLKQIGYLMLDDFLGEYDVEMKLGLIEMLPFESEPEMERYPLKELPGRFDRLVIQLDTGIRPQPS